MLKKTERYINEYDILETESRNEPVAVKMSKDDIEMRLPDSEGVFEKIDKELLHLDTHYQRPISSERRVKYMANNWNWVLASVLGVSLRKDGTYWAFDGGHRIRASLLNEHIEGLPCMVHEEMTIVDEAAAFYMMSKSPVKVSSVHGHKAALVAKDALSMVVDEIVSFFGYKIRDGSSDFSFRGVGAIYNAAKKDEDEAQIIFGTCAEIADNAVFTADLFSAMYKLVAHFKRNGVDVLEHRWLKNLVEDGSKVCEQKIKQFRATFGKKSKKADAHALLEIMNKRKKKRLFWDEQDRIDHEEDNV